MIRIIKLLPSNELQKNIKQFINNVLIARVKTSFMRYRQLYKSNKKKAILLLISLLVLMYIAIIFSINLFTAVKYTNQKETSDYYINNIPLGQSSVGSNQKIVVTNFLITFKKTIQLFTPIFDSFISETADVTGKSKPVGNGYSWNIGGDYKVEFITSTTMRPASFYYTKLLALILPIATLLIALEGFNLMTSIDENTNNIKAFMKRITLTGTMLIITPYILSISILGMNLIAKELTGNRTLTEFITNFIDTVQTNYNVGATDKFNNILNTIFTLGANNTIALIQSIPVILPFILILLLFLYISFQFILRYLNLYFLACIYPFVIIGYINVKTSKYPLNFWKQWITFLIHQPIFVLGYIIVQDLLFDLLKNGPSFEQILIFLAMLLFLSTINQVSAKIWGDIFSAVSTNIQSALGTGMAYKIGAMPISKSKSAHQKLQTNAVTTTANANENNSIMGGLISGASSLTSKWSRQNSIFKKNKNDPNAETNIKDFTNNEISSLNYDPSNIASLPTSEKIQGDYGFDVYNQNHDTGMMNIGGDFYKDKDNKTDLTTMYTSSNDALKDGVKRSSLVRQHIDSIKIRNLSSPNIRQSYTKQIRSLIPTDKDQNHISNIMPFTKNYNRAKGIEGLMVSEYPAHLTDNIKAQNKITKIHIYNDRLI